MSPSSVSSLFPFLIAALTILPPPGRAEGPWRSALYPSDWKPGWADGKGRTLPDFSYAGYHRGEIPLPASGETGTDFTKSPYSADPTGRLDATEPIQRALDDAGKAGGGVVFLPPGLYKLTLADRNASAALKLRSNRVVLRGAGPDKTFLWLDAPYLRDKSMIAIGPDRKFKWNDESSIPGIRLAEDGKEGSSRITLDEPSPFPIGTAIVARMDLSQAWIDALGMNGKWTPETKGSRILAFSRRIIGLSADRRTVTLDVPLRLDLFRDANARIEPTMGDALSEVGAEGFSVGMTRLSGDSLGELDHLKEGTTGYAASRSCALVMNGVENGWLRDIRTFAPKGNGEDVHLVSCGIRLAHSRFVTVERCEMRNPQYLGGSGDGYLFQLLGQECLIRDCVAEKGRHNFTFGNMIASGNVISGCSSRDGMLCSDFHMWYSPANLIEKMTFDGDHFEAVYRPYGNWGGNPVHGVTTTRTAFWNSVGNGYGKPRFVVPTGKVQAPKPLIIESRQEGVGFVIGTSGPACAVATGEKEFVEGLGEGATLSPSSLYEDQKKRRMSR